MQIEILGEITISVPTAEPARTRRTTIGSTKVRTLLACLALEAGRVVSVDELVEELWANRPLRNVRNALQAHVTRLRKVLDQPGGDGRLLRTVHGGYLLDVGPDAVDGHCFLELTRRGAALLRTDPGRALDLLETAQRMWRGPVLLDAGEGLRLRGAAALFEEARLTTWEDIASARLLLRDEHRALSELARLTEQHPHRERLCEHLMLALYRAGRQGDALSLFRRTRERLDRDLGVEPGVALRRLHSDILAQRPALWNDSCVLDHPVPAGSLATG